LHFLGGEFPRSARGARHRAAGHLRRDRVGSGAPDRAARRHRCHPAKRDAL